MFGTNVVRVALRLREERGNQDGGFQPTATSSRPRVSVAPPFGRPNVFPLSREGLQVRRSGCGAPGCRDERAVGGSDLQPA